MVVSSIDTTLDCTPESFTSVEVGNSSNILLRRVLNYSMSISEPLNVVVGTKLVSINNGFIFSSNILFNHWQESRGFNVTDN